MRAKSGPVVLALQFARGGGNMRVDVVMGSRGQVTIPKEMRNAFGLRSGSRFVFAQLRDGNVVMRFKRMKLSNIAGTLTRPTRPSVSIEEMRR
jgi:AbrB family looped-hinge helix DNA binding protein